MRWFIPNVGDKIRTSYISFFNGYQKKTEDERKLVKEKANKCFE